MQLAVHHGLAARAWGRAPRRRRWQSSSIATDGASSSDIAKSELSFAAFGNWDEALHKAHAAHIVPGGDRS